MAQTANPTVDLSNAEKGSQTDRPSADVSTGQSEDLLGLQDLDTALNMKMHLVNDVSNHLRQWKCVSSN